MGQLTKASGIHVAEKAFHHEIVIDGGHGGANLRHDGEVFAYVASGTIASIIHVAKGIVEQSILWSAAETLLLPCL